MNEFAIVSEGVTDHAVLKNILLGWFQDQKDTEPFLKPYQPDPTAEGESAWQEFGNWENVLKYLREKKHRDALEHADFLIVQIDTDQSEHTNFGVNQQENGKLLEPHALVAKVAEKLQEIIGPEDVAFYGDKIIFAICVREIECWLLPLWDIAKAAKCVGCMNAVDRALVKASQVPLNKDPERYQAVSKEYSKRKALLAKGRLNPSLGIFLKELERRNIALTAE
ncbi:MAG: hypothetical protein ABI162_15180 [Luteolibacter sp.]